MSLAGQNDEAAERNTSWGGSSNTSWGGSSNTSWGGSSNTSWGGSSNTSWGGGRGRAAIAALAVVLPVLAALPFAGHVTSTRGTGVAAASAADAPVNLDAAPAPHIASTGTINVRDLLGASYLGNGAGQTIAVLDSGVNEVPGLAGRVIQGVDLTGTGFNDDYGHGTFVASLIAGNGRSDNGNSNTGILGVAPGARIVSVKVAGANGASTVGRVVAGLDWVIKHRAQYGITVVNMSLAEASPRSYFVDPVDALAEAAQFAGMSVVASAGNEGSTVMAAPGNDPFVTTVGSVWSHNTLVTGDDTASSFSNAGTTPDKVVKPEVSTFGEHVQAALPASSYLASQQKVSGLPSGYGQMSGTSMSTGVAAGAIALLRALHPSWTPGQVKGALVATRSSSLGELRLISAAMQQNPADATKGLNPSLALAVAYAQEVLNTHDYANVTWSDVTWSDVTWSDVTWSDVTWSDVASAVQGAVTWSDVTWSDVTWSDVTWSDVTWSDSAWSDVTWSDNLGAG